MPAYTGNGLTQGMDAREALLCSRLNLRRARRLLQEGALKRGISALYDSVLFGMLFCIASRSDCAEIDLWDAARVFHELARLGIFEDGHAFNRLSRTVERILWQGAECFNAYTIVLEVEDMLTKLGVLLPHKSAPSGNQTSHTNRKEGDAYFQSA